MRAIRHALARGGISYSPIWIFPPLNLTAVLKTAPEIIRSLSVNIRVTDATDAPRETVTDVGANTGDSTPNRTSIPKNTATIATAEYVKNLFLNKDLIFMVCQLLQIKQHLQI